MYGELYQYLLLYKQLDLPGIGTLLIEKKPAYLDVADKVINPPAFTVGLNAASNTPSKRFFHWLGSKLGITERDAVIRFNDFLFELKKQLATGNKLEWSGVGTISKGPAGAMKLTPPANNHSPALPVPAIKVIRENAEHIIRVGEQEKTSAQMKEILHHPEEDGQRSYWWVAALVVVILSIIFIGYYFSVNGLNTSAASNQQKLVPQPEAKTH
jgi:hypothetical protein